MTSDEALSDELESKTEDNKPQIALELSKPGAVDEYFASFSEEKRKSLVEFQHKYNFDFVKEVPLPGGRYEWYPIDSSHENDDHGSFWASDVSSNCFHKSQYCARSTLGNFSTGAYESQQGIKP